MVSQCFQEAFKPLARPCNPLRHLLMPPPRRHGSFLHQLRNFLVNSILERQQCLCIAAPPRHQGGSLLLQLRDLVVKSDLQPQQCCFRAAKIAEHCLLGRAQARLRPQRADLLDRFSQRLLRVTKFCKPVLDSILDTLAVHVAMFAPALTRSRSRLACFTCRRRRRRVACRRGKAGHGCTSAAPRLPSYPSAFTLVIHCIAASFHMGTPI
mmetsp:Transcript_39146/g.103527  ORF Transcript_39146/g.103527 Transcript_39146/m.103527 type:complete len:210 (+) Transcript_39146:2216-2845(+)